LEDNLEKENNTPEEWNFIGLELYFEERYTEAIECFDAALSLKSDYFQAWKNKGMVLEGQGIYKDAAGCYDKALSFISKYSSDYTLLYELRNNVMELLQDEEDEEREHKEERVEKDSPIIQHLPGERKINTEEDGKSDFEL